MRIALDAMGTDDAPASEVDGALAAVERDPNLEVLLVGDESRIAECLPDEPLHDRLKLIHTSQSISTSESPVSALRRKPRASIPMGLRLQGSGEADGFVSAGSTGAVMAASMRVLRTIEGVDRPALAAPCPTMAGTTLVVDVGANLRCPPQLLLQFGRLGAACVQDMAGIEEPRVGLLNVGSEAVKGTGVLRRAHRLLAASGLNFVGNIEGRDIIRGACDVLVCDGMSGNVLLKFYESVAQFLLNVFRSRVGGDDSAGRLDGSLSDILDHQFRDFDYAEYGGIPLLGVGGVSVVCHGSSSAKAIRKAVQVAARAVRTGLVAHATRELAPGRNEA